MSARAVVAIARREFRERWLLVPLGLVVGVWPLAIAVTLGRENPPLPQPEDPVAVVISIVYWAIFVLLSAFVVGFSIAGRDLGERRLGFYFARPVAWPSLCLGQGLALVALIAASTVAVMVPLLASLLAVDAHRAAAQRFLWRAVAEPDRFFAAFLAPNGTLVALAAMLGVLCGISGRIRSRWFAVDLLGLAALGLLVRHAAIRLAEESAFPRFEPEPVAVVAGVIALSLASGQAAQLAWGRGEPTRAHRAFAVTAWPLLVGSALIGTVQLERTLAGGQQVVRSATSPDGRWEWVLHDKASWLFGRTTFLRRTDGSHVERLGSDWATVPVFSADSQRAAWVEYHLPTRDGALEVVDLGEVAITRLGTFPHPRTSWGRTVALSPGGDRVAVVDGLRVRVHALEPGARDRELALLQPAGLVHHFRFLDADTLCLRAAPVRQARAIDYRLVPETGAVIVVAPGTVDPCVAKP